MFYFLKVMNFEEAVKEYGIELSASQLEQFETYFRLLVEWNEKMNLTAITEKEEVYLKHFLDSLSLVREFETLGQLTGKDYAKGDFSVIDIGTGAGFPGIPLKILYPDLKVTLMDSLNKRITFLDEVIATLRLNEQGSIKAVHARAEELGHNAEYREQYDIVVSRAVSNLATLSEYCLPFAKVGGFFIPYKSEKAGEEIAVSKNAIGLCGGSLKKEDSFTLPQSDLKRTLLIIEKKKNTPKQYPRKAGTPAKKPL